MIVIVLGNNLPALKTPVRVGAAAFGFCQRSLNLYQPRKVLLPLVLHSALTRMQQITFVYADMRGCQDMRVIRQAPWGRGIDGMHTAHMRF